MRGGATSLSGELKVANHCTWTGKWWGRLKYRTQSEVQVLREDESGGQSFKGDKKERKKCHLASNMTFFFFCLNDNYCLPCYKFSFFYVFSKKGEGAKS